MDLEIIQDYFGMTYKFVTTPEVINEITKPIQLEEISKYLSGGYLEIDNRGSFDSIQSLFDRYPGLSYADCSVLSLAIRRSGSIITSDKKLRNISISRKINVYGILWIIRKLYEIKFISTENAINKLQEYSKLNIRVPKLEIAKMINELSAKK